MPKGTQTPPKIRARLFVNGVLIDEEWATLDDLARVAIRHAAMSDLASANGDVWLAETYDPNLPEEHQYARFGTDAKGMVQPKITTWEDILEERS